MSIKVDGKPWSIKEQIVDDPASGLSFQFEIGPDGLPRLRLFGDDLPFGNREFVFDENGEEAGAGTYTAGTCRPAWLEKLD